MTQDEQVHDYISTACHHGLHEQCRLVCKYCDSRCLCEHHRDEQS